MNTVNLQFRVFFLLIVFSFSLNLLSAQDNTGNVDIRITPDYYNFLELELGDPPASKEFAIQNMSDMFIACIDTFYFLNNAPSFSINTDELEVEKSFMPHEIRNFSITYTPLTEETVRDTLVFMISDCDEEPYPFKVILLAGSVPSSIYVQDMEFSEQQTQTKSEYRKVTITNSSEYGSKERLHIYRIQMSSNVKHIGHGYGFQVDSLQNINPDNPLVIEVDSSYTFYVRFVPVYRGEQEGTIYFVSDAEPSEYTKSKCDFYGIGFEKNVHEFSSTVGQKNHVFSYEYDELFETYEDVTITKMSIKGSVGGFESDKIFRIDNSYLNGTAFPMDVKANTFPIFKFDVNLPYDGNHLAEITFSGDFFTTTLKLDFTYEEVYAVAQYEKDTITIQKDAWMLDQIKVTNNDDKPLVIYGVEYDGDAGKEQFENPISFASNISEENPDRIYPGNFKIYNISLFGIEDGIFEGTITLLSNAVKPLSCDFIVKIGTGVTVRDKEIIKDYHIYYNNKTDEIQIQLNTNNQYSLTAKIFNINGQALLVEDSPVFAGENFITVNSDVLQSGIYLIQIMNNNKVILNDKLMIRK